MTDEEHKRWLVSMRMTQAAAHINVERGFGDYRLLPSEDAARLLDEYFALLNA